jgi:hypothetical protein
MSGLTDREITNNLRGRSAPQQPINIAARGLVRHGRLIRKKRQDGLIGNFLAEAGEAVPTPIPQHPPIIYHEYELAEGRLKEILEGWLTAAGWQTEIAWGKQRGIDIHALRGNERWVIEVKGIGSLSAMRVNYFLGILGETLQRMDDPSAKYSIALPDVPQFRKLWERLPQLAKKRTEISILFVTAQGAVTEVIE